MQGPAVSKPKPLPSAPPTPAADWQTKARALVEAGVGTLWSDAGVKPLDWLRQRGLSDETIRNAKLGYQATSGDVAGLYADRGVLIPWIAGDSIRFVQVRRPERQAEVLRRSRWCSR